MWRTGGKSLQYSDLFGHCSLVPSPQKSDHLLTHYVCVGNRIPVTDGQRGPHVQNTEFMDNGASMVGWEKLEVHLIPT